MKAISWSARLSAERRRSPKRLALLLKGVAVAIVIAPLLAQTPAQPDWKALEGEIIQQFQAVLRLDTRNPPGNEHIVAEYLKGIFDQAGIPAQIFALDPKRSNVVARLKGNGKKRPILIMGHSDVVTVDEANACSRASCIASSATTTKSSSISRVRGDS